jgi:hypothetical protein
MRHIYKVDSNRGIYWEVYDQWDTGDSNFIRILENQNEYEFYLDFLRECGVDFCIHNDEEEYDEYHVALPSV